jgi:putative redox protein
MTEKLLSRAKLVENFRINVDDGRTHSVCLDLQPDLGTDMGPSALELCVMSYAGCVATIFALVAKNSRVTVQDLGVKVEAIKSEEEGTITEVSCDVSAKTDALEDKVQRIFNLTIKTCPVGQIFDKAGIKTNCKLKIL